ncbi:hypothetical protein [Microbulbifer discodermiae]|uniref:hypothetical protein n=1 Tax=Microbulbifer sp. 2201CG32-9 TaxID=3232309 RepID=UPI00345C0952
MSTPAILSSHYPNVKPPPAGGKMRCNITEVCSKYKRATGAVTSSKAVREGTCYEYTGQLFRESRQKFCYKAASMFVF